CPPTSRGRSRKRRRRQTHLLRQPRRNLRLPRRPVVRHIEQPAWHFPRRFESQPDRRHNIITMSEIQMMLTPPCHHSRPDLINQVLPAGPVYSGQTKDETPLKRSAVFQRRTPFTEAILCFQQ